MKPRGQIATCIVLFAAATFSAAHANGKDDGDAGLSALDAGDYDKAIGMFTRALNSRDLDQEGRELAYASRGRAYLKKNDLSRAIVDLDDARRIKPDDADAQNDLTTALAAELPADAIPGRPKPSIWKGIGNALVQGALCGLQEGLGGEACAQNGSPTN